MQISVSCPGCGTDFRLDASKVPPEGLRARCSVCSAAIPVRHLPEDAPAISPTGDRPPAPEPQPTGAGVSPSPGPQPDNPPPLAMTLPDAPDEPPEVQYQVVHHGSREELLEMMLNAERERREMAWEMTKELFRLREVVDQQQIVVSHLVDTVSKQIPAPPDTNQLYLPNGGPPPAAATEQAAGDEELLAHQEALEEELQRLKTALDGEKEIVDRLRRGKLDLERRATDAEATIEALHKRGFLQRLLKRGGD